MTREDQHALWNRVLEHATSTSGSITLLSDGLDPTYVPVVSGLSVKLLSLSEIRELEDTHGQVEFVRLGDYHWYRGPIQVTDVRRHVGERAND